VLGLLYQTFGEQDYVQFFDEYAVRGADGKIPPWFQFDFGKPNVSLAHATRKDYAPSTGQAWVNSDRQRVLVEMTFEEAIVTNAGAPAQAWFEFFEGQQGAGDLRLQVTCPRFLSFYHVNQRHKRYTSSKKRPRDCRNRCSSPLISPYRLAVICSSKNLGPRSLHAMSS
jgi:hypothetical protein